MKPTREKPYDPEMSWQPDVKSYWCEVCQVMHPHYFKCRKEKEDSKRVTISDFRPNKVIELFWRELLSIEEDAEFLGVELI